MYYKWQVWYALKRDRSIRYDFIVNIVTKQSLVLKITSWKNKGKESYIYTDEIDEYLIFNK